MNKITELSDLVNYIPGNVLRKCLVPFVTNEGWNIDWCIQNINLEGLSPLVRYYQILCYVMPDFVPGIHASNIAAGGRFGHVDGRDKPRHDGYIWIPPEATE